MPPQPPPGLRRPWVPVGSCPGPGGLISERSQILKKRKRTSVGEDAEKLKPWCSAGGKQCESPAKMKPRIIVGSSHSPLSIYIEKSQADRCLHTHVHSSVIHNSQRSETRQIPSIGRMDKQHAVPPQSRILLSLKKEGSSVPAKTWMDLKT